MLEIKVHTSCTFLYLEDMLRKCDVAPSIYKDMHDQHKPNTNVGYVACMPLKTS